jgi:hypothetical protein
MNGRAFVNVARQLLAGATESHWRTAAGRAYYGLLLEAWEALQRWGFVIPPRVNLHHFIRQRFVFPADADLKIIGGFLDQLGQLRNRADYRLAVAGPFAFAAPSTRAVNESEQSILMLDQIEANPVRRAAAVAAIQTAFPP